MPSTISWFEILTLIALIAGPVVAVLIARNMDTRRAKHERRMDVFRTLMRTRRTTLSPDHVGALNLVEVEFKDKPTVTTEWIKYFEHLASESPKRSEEEISEKMTQEEKNRRFDLYDKRVGKERDKLLAILLHAIAKVLDFKIEQLEIFEGGYAPQGWNDIEAQQAAIRRFVLGLYFGDFKVPIAVTDYTNARPDEPGENKDDDPAQENVK